MLQIDVRHDIARAAKQVRQLSVDLREKAFGAALNKTVAKARTEMTRQIAGEFAIKQHDVRAQLQIRKATTKGARLIAQLQAFGRRKGHRSRNVRLFLERKVTLAEGRRRAKAGDANQLRFQIKKSGGRKIIKGAFLGNSGRTVFIREGKSRLPIKALETIDVPQMFNAKRINKAVIERINREFPVELQRAIRKYTTT